MRKDFGAKPLIYPMPVFIIGTYDENGVPNAMNAAWGGISGDTEITICLSESHKTTQNILKTKAFSVSMATLAQEIACDYVGIASANKDSDKIEKVGWHAEKSANVNAPLFAELPMTIECEFVSYENEHMIGKIVNVCADESILTDGKIDVAKLQPITYDSVNHKYYALGKAVGQAFSDGKKIK